MTGFEVAVATMIRVLRACGVLGFPFVLVACMVGPDYLRPPVDVGVSYKLSPGWVQADPTRAAQPKGAWWEIYSDQTLSQLIRQLDESNLTIAQAEAKYRQAVAMVQGAQAPLLPTINLGGNANRAGGSATTASGVVNTTSMSTYSTNISASWTLDIWGSVRRNLESQEANKEALAASLAGARLTAQSTLALTYIQLRVLDERARL